MVSLPLALPPKTPLRNGRSQRELVSLGRLVVCFCLFLLFGADRKGKTHEKRRDPSGFFRHHIGRAESILSGNNKRKWAADAADADADADDAARRLLGGSPWPPSAMNIPSHLPMQSRRWRPAHKLPTANKRRHTKRSVRFCCWPRLPSADQSASASRKDGYLSI